MDAPSPLAIDNSKARDQDTANQVADPGSDAGSETDTDPLLACLGFLTQFYKTPHSAAVLRAGLPLAEGHITPSLFVRAAAFEKHFQIGAAGGGHPEWRPGLCGG